MAEEKNKDIAHGKEMVRLREQLKKENAELQTLQQKLADNQRENSKAEDELKANI